MAAGQPGARGPAVRRFSEPIETESSGGLARLAVGAFAALAMLTSSCQGNNTANATPTPPAVTLPASASPTAAADIVHRNVIRGTFMFDFELGREASPTSADVWWQQVDSTRRFLVPRNGAGLALVRGGSFENASKTVLSNQRFSQMRLDGSDGPSNALMPGSVVAIRTHGGNLVKMIVNTYGFDLDISWVRFQ